MNKKVSFSIVACVVASSSSLVFAKNKCQQRPNILFILADDLGYGDVGCFGSQLTPTPYIDQLAEEGVRMTSFYVCPVSAPSRLGLMTGRYPQRLGSTGGQDSHKIVIPENVKLLPEQLRDAGYYTIHIGKWNVNRPAESVFDTVCHEIDWESDYFEGEEGVIRGAETKHIDSSKNWKWGAEGTRYLTDELGTDAVNFIRSSQAKEKPFFMYLAFNAVHSPLQAPIELRSRFEHVDNEALKLYGAMIHQMDVNVGRVLLALKEAKLEKNTLIVFLSDNGPANKFKGWPENAPVVRLYSTGVFSGAKNSLNEGGIRVPAIVKWPGVLKKNKQYDKPLSLYDVYATLSFVSGFKENDSLDGVNFIPYVQGGKMSAPHQNIITSGAFSFNDHKVMGVVAVVRCGKWKAVFFEDQRPQLYDLEKDPKELNDVSELNKRIVKKLIRVYDVWENKIK